MNFTKDYIELCKDKRIQELRSELKNFDYCIVIETKNIGLYKDFKMIACLPTDKGFHSINREMFLFLPNGDQLDEEIIKICKENMWGYETIFEYQTYYLKVFEIDDRANDITNNVCNDNPLIAKIKLLIQLLGKENQ